MSTSSMYRMKPLFEMNSIDVNTTMYKIKNIHDAGIVCNGTSEEDDSYLEFIEGRQEDILKRLKKLRDLLEAPITIQCRPSTKIDSPSVPVSCTKMTVQAVDFVKHGVSQDVVLNANPSHLPYSLLGLPKLWGGIVTMNVSCHAHSSVRSLPQAAKVLQDELIARSSTSGDAVGHLNVRLVWKEVETDSVCVISPLKTVPIFGEVNFLRFVDSCIAPQRDAVRQTVLDDKMDSVFALAVDPKNATHAQNVFALLKSSKWLLDDSPSVLDLAAWSVVNRQSKSIHLDPKGKQWFDNATKLFS